MFEIYLGGEVVLCKVFLTNRDVIGSLDHICMQNPDTPQIIYNQQTKEKRKN